MDSVARVWHAGVPAPPKAFPASVDMSLTRLEASYLKERVVESHRSSVFAYLLLQTSEPADASFVWEHPECQTLPPALSRQLAHARLFSETMYGASILYNLWLAELEPVRPAIVEECQALLEEWSAGIDALRPELAGWSLDDFWFFVRACGAKPSELSRAFVEKWIDYVRAASNPSELAKSAPARNLIATREHAIKGALARFENARSREVWQGAAGLGRMDFRWASARTLMNDVNDGLRGADA